MKIIIITSVLLLIFLIFASKMQISINPFKITFGSLYSAIGWILILIGIILIQHQSRIDAIKETLDFILKNINLQKVNFCNFLTKQIVSI